MLSLYVPAVSTIPVTGPVEQVQQNRSGGTGPVDLPNAGPISGEVDDVILKAWMGLIRV